MKKLRNHFVHYDATIVNIFQCDDEHTQQGSWKIGTPFNAYRRDKMGHILIWHERWVKREQLIL